MGCWRHQWEPTKVAQKYRHVISNYYPFERSTIIDKVNVERICIKCTLVQCRDIWNSGDPKGWHDGSLVKLKFEADIVRRGWSVNSIKSYEEALGVEVISVVKKD